MSEFVEHGSDENKNVQPMIVTGKSDTSVTMKVYQDIYHQITGRTEEIKRRYSDNILLKMDDLAQLHHKILQLCDVHNVIARNEVISVFHYEERKEQFTSFDRFLAYNSNSPNPCVTVVLKYNFSIIPSNLKNPQEYVVTVRLTSRVGLIRQAEEDMPFFMKGRLISIFADNTAEVTVEYADYVVARGFMEAFDEWIRGCRTTPDKSWLKLIQAVSHLLPRTIQILITLVIVLFSITAIPSYFSVDSLPDSWARFVVIYMGASYVLLALARVAGRILERAIDSIPVISYMNLNKGDERIISEFKGRRKGIFYRFAFGAIMAVLLGVISARIERFL